MSLNNVLQQTLSVPLNAIGTAPEPTKSTALPLPPPLHAVRTPSSNNVYLPDLIAKLRHIEQLCKDLPQSFGRVQHYLVALKVMPEQGSPTTAPKRISDVLRDLGVELPRTPGAVETVRKELEQTLNTRSQVLEPTQQGAPNTPIEAPPAKTLGQILADQQDLESLVEHLRIISMAPDGTPATPDQISYRLNYDTLVPYLGSHYALTQKTPPTLATVLTDLGFKLPSTVDELAGLTREVDHVASLNPLGNLGGGLGWPIPMSRADQHKIATFLHSNNTGVPGLPLPIGIRGTLGYLLSGSSVTQRELQDNPVEALHRLLDSPKAIALGEALQKHLEGVSSDTSIYEYVLTAINVGLEPESVVHRTRNKVTKVDLLQPSSWGKSPSAVVDDLSRNLIVHDRATADTTKLATHLLLSLEAPQFLIKDIPDQVKVGSQAWANLSIAAATIEAERPGSVPNMTFAQVMSHSQNTGVRPQTNESAQVAALVDWGVANGLIARDAEDSYSPNQINFLRSAFNKQLDDSLSASKAMDSALPSRKDIALAKLKERFGDLGALFEEKVLSNSRYRVLSSTVKLQGLHSMLDIAMMDCPTFEPFKSTDPRIPVEALNKNLSFGVEQTFDLQFSRTIEEKKAAVNTTVRHLISQLPLEDRKNFEFGKITLFQEGSHEAGFLGVTPNPHETQLIVKTELDGRTQVYEINFNKGTLERTDAARAKNKLSADGNLVTTTHSFTPSAGAGDLARERRVTSSPFASFHSGRTQSIANAFVEHLELDSPVIKQQARGRTALDELRDPAPLSEFFWSLIPFRSAIQNIKKGDYIASIEDLSMDVFGLLTAGAGAAGKLLKIGRSALHGGAKALQGAKVIGAAAIGVLNPASGLGDLAMGGVELINKGVRKLISKGAEAVKTLKGATGSYDLLKAASREYGVVATGTYKLGEQAIESGAVLSNGKWYAYDPITVRPYGPPLPMFNAKSIAMNGEIQNFRVLDHGLGMFEDMIKRGLRLTLDAHGVIPPGQSTALMVVNGNLLTPNEVVDLLRAHNVDMSKYTEIRLTMCHSGNGAGQSFAAQLSKLTHKPTEGFLGVMYGGDELEDVAARMFKNGGAKQREYIDQAINGQKKKVVKYKMTTMTADGRGIYTVSPDYNPVRFDAAGVPMAPKPLRTPYTAAKVELPAGERRNSNVDFSEYEDLT